MGTDDAGRRASIEKLSSDAETLAMMHIFQ